MNHNIYTVLQNQQHYTHYGLSLRHWGAYATVLLSDARQPEVDFFLFLGNVFVKILGQIVCIRVKKHGKTKLIW